MPECRSGLPFLVSVADLHPIDAEAVSRISSRAYRSGDCIFTTHAADSGGYPKCSVGGLPTQIGRYLVALREDLDYEDREGWQARHTCDNPGCINPEHLVSGTVADNANDKVMRRRSTRGERSSSAKLTIFDVLALRLFLKVPATVFANWHGVTPRAAQHARNGTTWCYLDDVVPPVKLGSTQ
ncbi:hypothetical protein [Ruegeria sp. HKCCA5426]|uniref:hypothetical protein n=1 Tax=Ruegeria sp. HKCCA5426 TaxID=2682985 RepID=UPI001488F69B|nr:hypothetical protein [Ruegeria sp. HKCCA5426]